MTTTRNTYRGPLAGARPLASLGTVIDAGLAIAAQIPSLHEAADSGRNSVYFFVPGPVTPSVIIGSGYAAAEDGIDVSILTPGSWEIAFEMHFDGAVPVAVIVAAILAALQH